MLLLLISVGRVVRFQTMASWVHEQLILFTCFLQRALIKVIFKKSERYWVSWMRALSGTWPVYGALLLLFLLCVTCNYSTKYVCVCYSVVICCCVGHVSHFQFASCGHCSLQLYAWSSTSCTHCKLPSNFVNGHMSAMWFIVCCWPHSQTLVGR